MRDPETATGQHAAGMPTIDDAPKDGTTIYSFDGTWWRHLTRWQHPLGNACLQEQFRSPKRWIYSGFLPIEPTHWCRPEDATPEIEKMVNLGLCPK